MEEEETLLGNQLRDLSMRHRNFETQTERVYHFINVHISFGLGTVLFEFVDHLEGGVL